MILKAGLTGGIATGKSTIAKILEELGCIVVDADQIVRDLYRPGEKGHRAIVERYGPAVLKPDGEIDRARLSAIALETPAAASELNRLIHPLVIEREGRMLVDFARSLGNRDSILVVEATLLLEAGGRRRYDRIVVVDVEPDVQVERAVTRGMDREEVLRRIARQMPREERLRLADYVIRNDGDLDAARRETERVYEALVEDLAEEKKNVEC